MSSPATIVPLVPRSKKANRNRPGFRPGFRPVGKAKPSKATAASATNKKTTNVLQENEASVASDILVSSTVVPTTASSTPDVTSAIAPTKDALHGRKKIIRRRKQSTGVSIGINQANKSEQTLAAFEPESPLATVSPSQSAVVVATPGPELEDAELIKRLREEDPTGVRLSSFCTVFKGEKRKREDAPRPPPPPKKKANHTKSQPSVEQESLAAPVVQIIDGEIVLQESSLVAPGARKSVQEVEDEFQHVVEEDGQLAVVGASYTSFVERKGPQRWTVEETQRFYDALRQLGTDFCSMEAYFDNRTRKQLKRKYHAESTKNPHLIEMALNPKYQMAIDLSVFDVVVDPKAIEAAANEEPPPHEPTDLEDSTEKDKVKNVDEWDVVHEEEDTPRDAALLQSAPQPSIWPDETEERRDFELDFPEPSMEDFFHHEEDKEESSTNSPPTTTPVVAEEETIAISLVPSKSKQKSKRPKFRSAVRKRK